jgi:hypothetical protein
MGIHLAAKGLYIEGSLGCHSNSKYTVTAFLLVFGRSSCDGSAQTGVQIGQESGHLLVRESACEGGHHSLPYQHILPHGCICSWNASEEGLAVEDAVQIRRDFLKCLVVILVAMGAADLVKVFAFRLLRGERGS